MKLRIAMFTEAYLPYINGVITHIKILTEGLTKMGHEVLIVTADPEAKHHYIKDGILHCPAKSSKRFYGFGLASPFSRTRLKLLKEFDPDIIHLHNEFAVGYSGISAAKALKKPVVYTMHTMYDEYVYYVAPAMFTGAVKRIAHSYSRYLAKRAAALTGPSLKVSEYFKSIGVEKDVKVIPNSVELDSFSPQNISPEQKAQFRARYQIPQEDMICCFVGRLGKEKSVDVLLDYWAQSIRPEDRIRLVIIGDGPEKEALEQQTRELGIHTMVTFTGKVLHKDIPPYYASCDVYVTASLSDTDSISMLEGMATGLPVLQRYDPLNADQVRDNINGYVFKGPEDMAKYLKKIKHMSTEELNVLKHSVIESVRRSGAADLANYLLSIYQTVVKQKSVGAKSVKPKRISSKPQT